MSNLVLLSCWFAVEPVGLPVLRRFFISRVPLNYRRSSGMVKCKVGSALEVDCGRRLGFA